MCACVDGWKDDHGGTEGRSGWPGKGSKENGLPNVDQLFTIKHCIKHQKSHAMPWDFLTPLSAENLPRVTPHAIARGNDGGEKNDPTNFGIGDRTATTTTL